MNILCTILDVIKLSPIFNMPVTGRQTAEKIACVAASCMQNLHLMVAITMQSCQYFAMTLGEQKFEVKNGDTT